MLLSLPELAEHIDHVNRDADRSSLVGNRTSDGLSDPPGGIGREFETPSVLVLVDGSHQTGISFLDQVQKAHTAISIFLGDGNHQSKIAAGKLSLDRFVLLVALAEIFHAAAKRPGAFLSGHDQVPEFAQQSLEL